MTDQVEDAQVMEQTGPPQDAAGNPGLSLNDIASFVQIIDIASRRGAFEGREMADIGNLRNRTETFLRAAAQQQGQNPQGMMPPQNMEAPADVPDGPLADKVVS